MGQGFSLTVTLQLAITSFPGLDTAAARLGIGNIRLFYAPLPSLTGEVLSLEVLIVGKRQLATYTGGYFLAMHVFYHRF